MDKALEELVRRRAGHLCEFCRMPQALYLTHFPIDHIIAQQHGGPTIADNLALACYRCNLHKGPNIASLDPLSGQLLVPLFHPRCDRWEDHFEWQGPMLIGRTPVGRATINVLAINHPDYFGVREELIEEGLFPPG